MLACMIVALAVLIGGAPATPPAPQVVAALPDEPGVVILPDSEPTLQAVVADLDGDGTREVVRLVRGTDATVVADAWREEGGGWVQLGGAVRTDVDDDGRPERAFLGRPVRLLIRAVDGADRVTLVRQPGELEDEVSCCLLLHDLRLVDGELRLVQVAARSHAAGAIHAIDFDGDGTDELLATRPLPRLAGVTDPMEARVYRWGGSAFGEPTTTDLPVGSGVTPVVLGDTDGLAGEEAGIIAAGGRFDLHRLTLDADDRPQLEAAGLVVRDALGVPLGDGRGLAVTGRGVGLAVMGWPRGEPVGAPLGDVPLEAAQLIGVAGTGPKARLLVRSADADLGAFSLPELVVTNRGSSASRAAVALANGQLRPYEGTLPRGGPGGTPAVVADGRLYAEGAASEMATLAGAEPVGLAGRELRWLAIRHAPTSRAPLDPRGGRLDQPPSLPSASVALVPFELALEPEADGGQLAPRVSAAVSLPTDELLVADDGLLADVDAPPGSRIYLSGPDPTDRVVVLSVDASGRALVRVTPPGDALGGVAPSSMTVVTPAGHAYRAEWNLRVASAAPALRATTDTSFGAGDVKVSGETAPYAAVTVAGASVTVDADGRFDTRVRLPPWPTDVTVIASDPFGRESSVVVTGVGLFDYRALPWVPIVASLTLLAGVLLYLRVPRRRDVAAPASDDALLEELEPDESV